MTNIIEKQEKQALRQFLENGEDKFRISLSAEHEFYNPLNVYDVKYKGSDEIQSYIVSSDTDELFNKVEESLRDLRSTMTGTEWRESVLPYICGVNEDDSSSDITQAVIDQYGYGHELSSYDNKTHEEEVNNKTFYIMRI